MGGKHSLFIVLLCFYNSCHVREIKWSIRLMISLVFTMVLLYRYVSLLQRRLRENLLYDFNCSVKCRKLYKMRREQRCMASIKYSSQLMPVKSRPHRYDFAITFIVVLKSLRLIYKCSKKMLCFRSIIHNVFSSYMFG